MFLRSLLALGVTLSIMLMPVSGADEAKKAKGKKKGGVAGVVEAFEGSKADGAKGEGVLKIKTVARKKKKAAAAAADEKAGEVKSFTITKDTKIQKVSGKKADRKTEAGSAEDLKAGARVRIKADGDKAQEITVLAGKKAKKKKAE